MSRGATRQQRRRARLALVAACLWLFGFELVPDLHLALHDYLAPHTHDGDGISFVHRHADGTVHRISPAKHRRAGDGADIAIELEHGAHSLAHHAAAVRPTLPSLVVPVPVDRRPVLVKAVAVDELVSIPSVRAVARGPPSHAFA
ncbi:MAG TPA: hypothetical protein VMJ10_00405 [Kofleriaceae bacterium]|nr:hypothetical protein [Kofleriaceae bacterium]